MSRLRLGPLRIGALYYTPTRSARTIGANRATSDSPRKGWFVEVHVSALPFRWIGFCFGPLIVIRQSYANDLTVLTHELVHCAQCWREGLLRHGLKYLFNARYRLESEIEAYGSELALINADERYTRATEFSVAICSAYRVNTDVNFVVNRLLEIASSSL